METAQIWFVEGRIGRIRTYLTPGNTFTLDLVKARKFTSKLAAEQEFNESPHFGTTPAPLQVLATNSLLQRKYPEHSFRAVCLEVGENNELFD